MVEYNTNAALELLRLPQVDTSQGNALMAQGIAQMMRNRRGHEAANMLAQAGDNVTPNTLAQIAAVDPSIAQMFAQQQASQQRQAFQAQQYQDEQTQAGQQRISIVSREADKIGTRAYMEAMAQGQTPKDAERKGTDARNSFISSRAGAGEVPQSMSTHLIQQPFAPTPLEKTSQELRNESTEMQIKQRAELAKLEHERNLAEIEARKRAAGAPRASARGLGVVRGLHPRRLRRQVTSLLTRWHSGSKVPTANSTRQLTYPFKTETKTHKIELCRLPKNCAL